MDHEAYWLERFSVAPAEPPLARSAAEGEAATVAAALDLPGATEAELAAAFVAWVGRLTGSARFSVGFRSPETGADLLPLSCELAPDQTIEAFGRRIADELGRAAELAGFARALAESLPAFERPRFGCSVEIADGEASTPGAALTLVIRRGGGAELAIDRSRFDEAAAVRLPRLFAVWARAALADRSASIARLPVVDEEERRTLLERFNATQVPYPTDVCVHQLFEAQARRTPAATALVHEGSSLSYQALDARANRLAHHLRACGAGPDRPVGLCVPRGEALVIAALAIQKAGAAYLPLDPAYPQERVAFMIEDSGAPLIVCNGATRGRLPAGTATLVDLDQLGAALEAQPETAPESGVGAGNLAYTIYTSGSTGKPKGVLIEHRTVVNFFVGMDAHIDAAPGSTWLAVTSLSFDISVLELFWTLSRGFKVVLAGEDRSKLEARRGPSRPIDFSLFYFASDEDQDAGAGKYRLLIEGAKFADRNGFAAVWTPERHFGAFGGLYPSPSVAGGALAMITSRAQIRAGSCVVPLHHPVRVAEEWALVDNLSGGRVGISFASGWHPTDFLLRPESFADRRGALQSGIDAVRRLWRGEAVEFDGPTGKVKVSTRPRPVQPELPFWVTAAGNPATFEAAGKLGANLLTHLLGQSLEEVAEKIQVYRRAWRAAGHPGEGKVTLMLHTLVGEDEAEVKRLAREPMKRYLRSAIELIGAHAWSFPAFKQVARQEASMEDNFLKLSPEDMDALLEYSFERYYERSGLFGTPESCLAFVERLQGHGVDEIASLIDFGVETETVLASLPALDRLRNAAQAGAEADDHSIAAQIARHGATHLQCTPSMARMLLANDDTRAALGRLRHLMVGGEALSEALVQDLAAATTARISNMYGPTETTIWSSVDEAKPGEPVTIGRPIANTSFYVLDPGRQPVPIGIPGELYIGGDGLARGYHAREALTAERFVPDPFAPGRMYRTGDLVRFRPDGRVEFLGRLDQQVKVRGYRIELGEIEARMAEHPGVREAVVVVREDRPGDPRLIGYVLADGADFDPAPLREHLAARLPDYMVPSAIVRLQSFPLTPNRKVDRKALPAPSEGAQKRAAVYEQPQGELEPVVVSVYQAVLGVERLGRDDNFFESGGHSLLAVQAHRRLKEALGREDLAITDIFRFPTVRGLCAHLSSKEDGAAKLDQVSARAGARREALLRRRQVREQA